MGLESLTSLGSELYPRMVNVLPQSGQWLESRSIHKFLCFFSINKPLSQTNSSIWINFHHSVNKGHPM